MDEKGSFICNQPRIGIIENLLGLNIFNESII
jgi:hypothetical protein